MDAAAETGRGALAGSAGAAAASVGPDEQLRTSAAHVLVADAVALASDDAQPELDPADAHHLWRVLRLRPGEVVTVTDGAGRWRRYRWGGGAGARLTPDGPLHVVPAPQPQLTVGFAPAKGDRPEWTVQKLTELGVDRLVPLRCARSVVRWEGDRGAQQVQRMRRVAREASMQARRCHVPQIEEVSSPADVPGAALAHFGGAPPSLARPVVLVGPEGGWAGPELELGLPTVSLGPLVLRAETAALAAAVVLTAIRQRMVVASDHGAWSAALERG